VIEEPDQGGTDERRTRYSEEQIVILNEEEDWIQRS